MKFIFSQSILTAGSETNKNSRIQPSGPKPQENRHQCGKIDKTGKEIGKENKAKWPISTIIYYPLFSSHFITFYYIRLLDN